jgi:hypothetical protein
VGDGVGAGVGGGISGLLIEVVVGGGIVVVVVVSWGKKIQIKMRNTGTVNQSQA